MTSERFSAEMDVRVESDGIALPARLTRPPGAIRAGVVTLHPASAPSRDFFLFQHLALVLLPLGVSVLSFDRRASARDLPFETQATDALAAMQALRAQAGIADLPVGLWGFSQGAWAAAVAAARSAEVAFLVLVASTGVSPAVQMRYGTAYHLRRAGFNDDDLVELAELRGAFEAFQRGERNRGGAQAVIDALSDRPWFPLAYVPRELPASASWQDMDFDPVPTFSRVRCPVLLFYGEDDEWTPIEESIAGWQRGAVAAGNAGPTVVRLPGTLHHPTLVDGRTIETISPRYTETLVRWLDAVVPT